MKKQKIQRSKYTVRLTAVLEAESTSAENAVKGIMLLLKFPKACKPLKVRVEQII